MNQFIELLAPAKNCESGKIAINYGADAVYIGAPKFGARAAAGNSMTDIAALIRYAHLFRAKVYVAVNTIIYDHEFPEVLDIIRQIHDAEADALIIQDMGLLRCELPPVPLFASTQTNNIDADYIKFLEDVGIQRAILARELSIQEIQIIRSKTTLELECFIHGALCVSHSGRCYMSRVLSGRSANRGECAQACRLPWNLYSSDNHLIEKNKHLLSPKDLNLTHYIENLIDAGISSFKIEGRLKDESYVKNIVAHYRSEIDKILERKNGYYKISSGSSLFHFIPNPEKSFNRGFTNYFIEGRKGTVIQTVSPKSMGEFIGEIVCKSGKRFTVDTTKAFHNGDGICFVNQSGEFTGTSVLIADNNQITVKDPEGIVPGTKIYRNFDIDFEQTLKNDKSTRKVFVNLKFEKFQDYFVLIAEDENGISVQIKTEEPFQAAKNKEKAIEIFETQLRKTGNTHFTIDSFTINVNAFPFLPINKINDLRRNILSLLEEKRAQSYHPLRIVRVEKDVDFPNQKLSYEFNVANQKAVDFYQSHGVTEIEPALELQEKFAGKTVMTTHHCLKFHLGLCPKYTDNKDIEILQFPEIIENGKRRFKLIFDCKNCLMKIETENRNL